MQFIRSLIFNIFLYVGLIIIFILAIPTLILPSKFTLFFGRVSEEQKSQTLIDELRRQNNYLLF